jgi:hypothetical protein
MALDATDEARLLGATAQGRCLFTFNVRYFLALARSYPHHGGVILAAQQSWTLSDLIAALDRLLSETEADDWNGQARWLNPWRNGIARGFAAAPNVLNSAGDDHGLG